jgi:hypothetical protein
MKRSTWRLTNKVGSLDGLGGHDLLHQLLFFLESFDDKRDLIKKSFDKLELQSCAAAKLSLPCLLRTIEKNSFLIISVAWSGLIPINIITA